MDIRTVIGIYECVIYSIKHGERVLSSDVFVIIVSNYSVLTVPTEYQQRVETAKQISEFIRTIPYYRVGLVQ